MTTGTGPIFVVGAMGSGTTVMRLILDSHDNIAMAQETGFARVLLANEWAPFAADVTGEWYRRIGLTRDSLERELADFYGGLFSKFAAQRGASRWGDKTPSHVWHLELLARVFPDAVFIGMVRHPGAGANSRSHRMGSSWRGSLRHWTRRNLELFAVGATLGERFMLCRYEDLVLQPEPVLRELFDWLGEPWSDRLLAFHEVHRERGTPRQVEGWTHSDEPLDASRVDAWTAGMTPQRSAQLAKGRVRKLCRVAGYRADAAVPMPWDTGTHLLRGDQLAARLPLANGVDFTERPRPSLPNRQLTLRDLKQVKRRAARKAQPPTALERVDGVVRRVGSRVLPALPAAARRPVRSVWWRIRARLRRNST